jgi:hypothetical protein
MHNPLAADQGETVPVREAGQNVPCKLIISRMLAEEQDLLDIIQRVRLQGGQLVHQDQELVGHKAGVVQLFGGPLGDAESI